jgi:hypothetical protein
MPICEYTQTTFRSYSILGLASQPFHAIIPTSSSWSFQELHRSYTPFHLVSFSPLRPFHSRPIVRSRHTTKYLAGSGKVLDSLTLPALPL